jgi:hypothetical protein
MLAAKNGGFTQLERGTVILADFAGTATSRRFALVAAGSRLVTKGQVVWRGLDAGIIIDNSDVIVDDSSNPWHSWLFEPGPWPSSGPLADLEPTGTPSNANGVTVDGSVSEQKLPHLYGEVGSSYAVVSSASSCACTRLPTASTVRTTTVDKAVSADGGVNAVSEEQQSIITGGTPNERRIMPPTDQTGIIGDDTRKWLRIRTLELVTGDLVMAAPDGSARYRFMEARDGVIRVHEEIADDWFMLPLIRIDPPPSED